MLKVGDSVKQRREQIKKYIVSKGFVSLTELSSLFPDVSTMTLRRDLEYLESDGEIVRTKGGAKSIIHLSMMREESYNRREFINPDLKKELAVKAASLIEDNSCVFFDAGSTVMEVVKALGQKPMYTITSGPNIAVELTKNKNCTINVVCGHLHRENISLSGLNSIEFLKGINIGTAVIAASGFTQSAGFTCGNFDECQLKKAVIAMAARVIIVMDSTKLGRSHPFTFAHPEDVDYFVTDDQFDPSVKAKLEADGLRIF